MYIYLNIFVYVYNSICVCFRVLDYRISSLGISGVGLMQGFRARSLGLRIWGFGHNVDPWLINYE